MAIGPEHGLKFAALHRQWRRLHMSEKFSSGAKKTNNKHTKKKQTLEKNKGITCLR